MKTSLVVMAAGIGSRFKGGVKQLSKVNNNGDTIVDFSIYDAKKAGFDKVVFIIRKDIEEDFRNQLGKKIEDQVEVEYAFQEVDMVPEAYRGKVNRTKPWGTVHAIVCAKEKIKEPFLIINADDYYGKDCFSLMHEYLLEEKKDDGKIDLGMVSFILKNTLSDNGSVTRGICLADERNYLKEIRETHEIQIKDGKLICKEEENYPLLGLDTKVSMNTRAGYEDFLEASSQAFEKFLSESSDLSQDEFVIPNFIEDLIGQDKARIKMLPTEENRIGITYKEDLPLAREEFDKMIRDGRYPEKIRG